MSRKTYVLRDGVFIEKHLAPRPVVQRSHLSMPMVISDHLSDVWNPANGKTYDSKSSYYQAVKDAGCEVMGNDPIASRPAVHSEPVGVEQSISDAIDRLT